MRKRQSTTKKAKVAAHPRTRHSRPRPGETPNTFGPPPKKSTLLDAINRFLSSPSTKSGKGPTRLDVVAEAFVESCEAGSYVHTKELLDRQEGKVPTRVGNADGTNLKGYIGIPVEGDDAP